MDNNTIKYKFLNYKTHRAYAQDLADGKISDESLVFVQDARCIWARGVKYDCNTRVQIEGNTISVLDSDSNVVLSANFATKDEFDSAVDAITQNITQLSLGVSACNTSITEEYNRASAEESRIEDKLDDEIGDRINAINNEVEERNLVIQAEAAQRSQADDSLQRSINTESFRAQNVEQQLDRKIDDGVLAAKSKYITSAEYINTSTGDNKQAIIRFKNDNGDVVSTIDATDFIVDGMIDSVSIVDDHGDKGLKLVFNTDSGREEVVLDIGDLFELDNYYTNDQIDTKESSLQSAIDGEIQARETADSVLGNRITDEAAARQSADVALNAAISALQNNKQNNLTAGEGIDITDNVISVDDYIGESDINGKLNTLQQMLGQIYVLKRDVSTPTHQWSEAPIYSFGDLPSPSSQETPNRSDILVLNQNAFNTLEQNNELRNDVCYLITD